MKVAGVMSGTSLDGIDVAIVDIRGRRIQTLGFQTTPYSPALRERILNVAGLETVSRLNYELAELYARAVLRAVKRFGQVKLVGCHGQTVFHEGGKNTLQLGEPAILAERTGVPVVSNFRARDIAAGGQGAPLVPYLDYLLFRHPRRLRVALNIGGIANISVIPPGARPQDVVAFDTGPGNMVIDSLVREYSGGKLTYDRGGKIAESGHVNRQLLTELLSDSYYRARAPKSAGREQYGVEFVTRLKQSRLPMKDLIATVTLLTAATIARAIKTYGSRGELIVSGGGSHNPQITNHLAGFLPGWELAVSSDYGIDADAKEAIAFALLAAETWRGHTSNLRSATGARKNVVLGSITP
jgi:anhydro-N-acetylmuramic acid kinase